jgi:hypothetical protein
MATALEKASYSLPHKWAVRDTLRSQRTSAVSSVDLQMSDAALALNIEHQKVKPLRLGLEVHCIGQKLDTADAADVRQIREGRHVAFHNSAQSIVSGIYPVSSSRSRLADRQDQVP